MTTEPQSPLSETDKLAATLAELERERQRRLEAGKWLRGTLPMLMAVPQAGETLQAAQQRALYGYLAEHPDAPKTVSAYEWIELEVVDPEPTIELPGMQYAPDHADARDVTPPWRPPLPPPSPPPPRDTPKTYSNAGVPAPVLEAELKRLDRFLSGDWGDPASYPLRYPRGNRNGW
jgi:hypothetical protein